MFDGCLTALSKNQSTLYSNRLILASMQTIANSFCQIGERLGGNLLPPVSRDGRIGKAYANFRERLNSFA
jgi:hypothetical protein